MAAEVTPAIEKDGGGTIDISADVYRAAVRALHPRNTRGGLARDATRARSPRAVLDRHRHPKAVRAHTGDCKRTVTPSAVLITGDG